MMQQWQKYMLNTPVPTAPCFCRKWSLHTLNCPFRSLSLLFSEYFQVPILLSLHISNRASWSHSGSTHLQLFSLSTQISNKMHKHFYSQCCMKKNHNPTTPYRWVTSISEMCCPVFYHWINRDGSLGSFSITCRSRNINWHLLPVRFLLHYQ